eukprot:462704-Prorocentrum_minimum.AAC.1
MEHRNMTGQTRWGVECPVFGAGGPVKQIDIIFWINIYIFILLTISGSSKGALRTGRRSAGGLADKCADCERIRLLQPAPALPQRACAPQGTYVLVCALLTKAHMSQHGSTQGQKLRQPISVSQLCRPPSLSKFRLIYLSRRLQFIARW